jgi:hypothetical protein
LSKGNKFFSFLGLIPLAAYVIFVGIFFWVGSFFMSGGVFIGSFFYKIYKKVVTKK